VFTTAACAALLVGALVMFANASASAQCVGDCNSDGEVKVNELILAVNIFLGSKDISECTAVDSNANGTVAINELVQAVNSSLRGCDAPPPPTPTPAPMVSRADCVLADTSSLKLTTALFPIPFEDLVGELAIECAEPAGATSGLSGDLACTCSVTSFGSILLPGVGDVCIAPFEPCEPRVLSCDGGRAVDINVVADHNIGACTGTADCASTCDSFCDGLGTGYNRQVSTCEDFCAGGEKDGDMCAVDADCPDGSCGGPDGGTDGAICECVCAQPGAGPDAGAGAFSCGLGVSITVEFDESGACGDSPPTITLDPVCGELTSGTSIGELRNVANTTGVVIGPTTLTGNPTSCTDLKAGNVSGLNVVGHLAFFGSAVGDILTDNNFVCE